MAFTKFRLRRDTLTNWTTVNPVLLEGEFVIVTPDTGTGKGKVKIKQGDGVTAFNSLPYAYNEAEIDINVLGLAFEDWAVTTPVPSAETALSNIVTGANSGTLWSNLKAFLKSTITTGKIVNNLISTTTGLALDSTQGKALKDMIDTTNNNLGNKLGINDNNGIIQGNGNLNAFTTIGRYVGEGYYSNMTNIPSELTGAVVGQFALMVTLVYGITYMQSLHVCEGTAARVYYRSFTNNSGTIAFGAWKKVTLA